MQTTNYHETYHGINVASLVLKNTNKSRVLCSLQSAPVHFIFSHTFFHIVMSTILRGKVP